MADQNLVPKDQPYGSRQQAVADRRRAGLNLDPSPQAPLPGGTSGQQSPTLPAQQARPTPPRYDPLLEATPDRFPAVSTTQPSSMPTPMQATMSPQEYAFDLASRSNNGLLRAVAARRAGGFTPPGNE